MPIEFACEFCGRLLRVPDGTAGSRCQCPACEVILEIPDPHAVGVVDLEDACSEGNPSSPQNSQDRLRIPCPKCDSVLNCDAGLLGTKGQCRQCGHIFLISTDPLVEETVAGGPDLIFSCPKCDQLFEGREGMQGRKGKCHSCGAVFLIELRRESASQPPCKTGKRGPETSSEETQAEITQPARDGLPPNPVTRTALGNIQLACSRCHGLMEVPGNTSGRTTACPFCQQLIRIPEVP